jgi:hypothetical protein
MGENRLDVATRLFWTYIMAAFVCGMVALVLACLSYQAPQRPAPAVHINGWRGDE